MIQIIGKIQENNEYPYNYYRCSSNLFSRVSACFYFQRRTAKRSKDIARSDEAVSTSLPY